MKKWGESLSQGVRMFRVVDFDGREQTFSLWASGGKGWSARHLESGESTDVELGHRELRIGSDPSVDVVLRDPHVAPNHCRISEEGGQMVLRDRGFGVRLNGQRCTEPTRLQEGDQIEIGSSLIELLRGRSQLDVAKVQDCIRHQPQQWSQADDERRRARYQRLRQRARLWSERGRVRRRLLAAKDLEGVHELRQQVEFDRVVVDFVEASIRGCRRRQVLVSVATGLLPSLLLSAYILAPLLRPMTPGVDGSETSVETSVEKSVEKSVETSVETSVEKSVEHLAESGSASTVGGLPVAACKPILHRVIEIDTLESLALDYDVPRAEIIRENELGPDGRLSGTLRLCSTVPEISRRKQTYTVVEGDTLESIAANYKESPAFLRGQLGRDELVPGMTLRFWARRKFVRTDDDGPPELRPGSNAEAIGPPNEGSLRDGQQIESDGSYSIRCRMNAYASAYTYKHLYAALKRMRVNYDYKGELIVGDISREKGGAYGAHLSHQNGRDVDLWLPIEGGRYRQGPGCGACGTPWCRPDPSEVDWAVTWQLIESLREGGAVQGIFIDKSLMEALVDGAMRAGADRSAVEQIVSQGRGQVSHAANHNHHIHVRFHCGPEESECVERVARKKKR
ncbi:MAG TPA: FHA domain-containing protein [Nannocystis exedens]|nr:FHA domain-containing protein [Nannocystis exedens]